MSAGDANWHGVHAVMVTPFRPDLSVDWDGLRANAQFLSKSTVDVLVCLGSEGEFYALTDDERRRVCEVVVGAAAGRKPVIVGVSHSSTLAAQALAHHAATSGASAIMATPPYFVRVDDEGITLHYKAIAAAGLPVFIYNSPARVGFSLSPRQILALARASGAVGVKQAAPDLSELAELLHFGPSSGFAIIGGAEVTFWPSLCVGAHGNTATAASAFPDVFAALWVAASEGDLRTGQSLYDRLAPLRRAYVLAGGQAPVVKHLMDLVGLTGGPVRPPLRPVSSEAKRLTDEVAAVLAERRV